MWNDAHAEHLARLTGVTRYIWLCSDANPDELSREGYRRLAAEKAGQPIPEAKPADPELWDYIRRHGCCG